MIISRTPFRVSIVGGGTDLPAFYSQEAGAVLSTTINKYMFITVSKRFDHTVRVSYSLTEIVETAEDIRHPIVREAMKCVGIKNGIQISSIADIPAGTGLGSSSSFTVGLLNALYAYLGYHKAAEELARLACQIEIDILKEPIGKQDQYAAAYGGLLHIRFNPDETVFVDPVICCKEVKEKLDRNLMMFYTGISRSARDILHKQNKKTQEKFDVLKQSCGLVERAKSILLSGKNLDAIGELLHQAWLWKKSLVSEITNPVIDRLYTKARRAGAIGGKILGAGGGGFLLLYCPKQRQNEVRTALKGVREFEFNLEPQGSKIIYVA